MLRATSGTGIAVVVLALLTGGVAYRYWPSDERAIRRHLSSLSELVSTPVDIENEAVYLTRQAAIREYFAPDVQVRVAEGFVASREPLLAALAHGSRQGPVVVHLVDVAVRIADDRATARVALAARVAAARRTGDETRAEVRHADLAMAKVKGDWLITVVEERERRPRP